MDPLTGYREIIADPPPSLYFDAFDRIAVDSNQVLLVAEQASKVIGSLQMTFIQHLISRAFRRAVLEAIFVHPSHQGIGVGTALIQSAAKIALEADCIALELTSNKAREGAHSFYEHLEFKPSHEGFKLALKKG